MWLRSAFSAANGNCVEAAKDGDFVQVRDSKNEDGPSVVYDAASWDDGRAVRFLPLPTPSVPLKLREARPDCDEWYKVPGGAVVLYFTAAEVAAWLQGVEAQAFMPA